MFNCILLKVVMTMTGVFHLKKNIVSKFNVRFSVTHCQHLIPNTVHISSLISHLHAKRSNCSLCQVRFISVIYFKTWWAFIQNKWLKQLQPVLLLIPDNDAAAPLSFLCDSIKVKANSEREGERESYCKCITSCCLFTHKIRKKKSRSEKQRGVSDILGQN